MLSKSTYNLENLKFQLIKTIEKEYVVNMNNFAQYVVKVCSSFYS
jgi:hypothetical protein